MSGERKSVMVRLRPEEYEALAEEADNNGRSMGAEARQAILRWLKDRNFLGQEKN